MSNTERAPQPVVCQPSDERPLGPHGVQVIAPREVPLGGPRAMTVRRTLPSRQRSFVGAWCFVDHYGPDDVRSSGGMDVPPHPHTGLSTVSWLFEGEVEHRDSAGVHTLIRPGELNLMTSGAGIAHSEVSTARTSALHGVQLWVVLPADRAQDERDFAHFAPEWVTGPSVRFRVFLGEIEGARSPVSTPTPLVGVEVIVEPGAEWRPAVDRGHEHAVLVDTGEVTVNEVPLGRGDLGCVDVGLGELRIANQGLGSGSVAASRWRAVRRGRDHVVELHRAVRRGDRALPAGVAGRRSAVRAGSSGTPVRSTGCPLRACRRRTSSHAAIDESAELVRVREYHRQERVVVLAEIVLPQRRKSADEHLARITGLPGDRLGPRA